MGFSGKGSGTFPEETVSESALPPCGLGLLELTYTPALSSNFPNICYASSSSESSELVASADVPLFPNKVRLGVSDKRDPKVGPKIARILSREVLRNFTTLLLQPTICFLSTGQGRSVRESGRMIYTPRCTHSLSSLSSQSPPLPFLWTVSVPPNPNPSAPAFPCPNPLPSQCCF